MKKRVLTIVVAMVIIAACVGALAGCNTTDGWERISSRGKIVMGFDSQLPPMGFEDGENNYVGFDIDVAKEVAAILGVELKLRPIKWSKKEMEMKSKKVDVIWNGFTVTEERKENFSFSIPYMENKQVAVVLANSAYNTIESLAGKKIGVQHESSAEAAIDASEHLKNSGKTYVEDNVKALELELKSGNVDAVVMDSVVAKYYVNLENNSGKYRIITGEGSELASEMYAIGFRKENNDDFIAKVNDALRELKANGKLAQISIKWFEEDITTVE